MVPRNNSAGLVFFIFHLKLHHVANMRVGRLKPRQPVNPGLPEKTDGYAPDFHPHEPSIQVNKQPWPARKKD